VGPQLLRRKEEKDGGLSRKEGSNNTRTVSTRGIPGEASKRGITKNTY